MSGIHLHKPCGKTRIILMMLADVICVSFSLLVALVLRKGFDIKTVLTVYSPAYSVSVLVVLLVFPVVFYLFKVYKVIWKFAGFNQLFKMACISAFTYLLFTLISTFISVLLPFDALPMGTYTIGLLFSIVCLVFSRVILRRETIKTYNKNQERNNRTMVIGGGEACALLLREINYNKELSYKPVCIIDDDPTKKGRSVYGVSIAGSRGDIITVAEKYDVDTILFAIPSVSAKEKAEILNICTKTGCVVKTMPNIGKVLDGKETIGKIQNVEIKDLLGREQVETDLTVISDFVHNKTVLVTGGGGSIGSELCRQIASFVPKRLVIFDIYENNAYDIQNELKRTYPKLDLVTIIGSVRDVERLDEIFLKYRPELVYHAAAHKHVPLMEDSPNESIKNNVFGTLNTARAADKYGVSRFVLISTDKAVNPTNIMGATKRICEMIVQTMNKHSKTDYVAVRFGNVLGSNGSVIPLFRKQIDDGGPVTVTDPEIIRYFMTIPEAVSLVLQAGAFAKGGEIFVLDMGEPMKILTLAENLIRLSGFIPYKDIEIKFTGLRPGEKLYEELLMSEEGLTETENNMIHVCQPITLDEISFFKQLDELHTVMVREDKADIREYVKKIVTTYRPL